MMLHTCMLLAESAFLPDSCMGQTLSEKQHHCPADMIYAVWFGLKLVLAFLFQMSEFC